MGAKSSVSIVSKEKRCSTEDSAQTLKSKIMSILSTWPSAKCRAPPSHRLDAWMDGWMDGWMGRWVDGWMVGWVDEWIGGWMDGWMDGWVNGWVDR